MLRLLYGKYSGLRWRDLTVEAERGSCSNLMMVVSEDGDFDEDGKGRHGEKWLDLGYILKIKQSEISEKLIMGCDRN